MPRQKQVGFLRRWGSKFFNFADLANRAIPLYVLHWYSRSDYSSVLTQQIISNESDAYLHGLLLFYLHLVALAATVSTSCTLLGLHLVSFTLICTHLPWLEESRQKFAVLVTELEQDLGHAGDVNGASDFRIETLYRVFLQVFVGLAVMRFPNFSVLYSSTAFSPLRVLTLGPVISTIMLAIFPGDYLTSRLSVLVAVFTVIPYRDTLTNEEAFKNHLLTFRQDTAIFYAHLRRSCARLERLQVSRIFSLFFTFCMIEIAVQISAEAPSVSTPLTWSTLGEELLRRSCDTTVSLIGFASVVITGISYFMRGVRDVLRLQGAGEDLKVEFFLLYFSLAVFAEAPLSNHRVGLDCLIRFLSLYVLSWMTCILQSIDYQVRSLGKFPNIPRESVLRIILADCFVVISIQLVPWTPALTSLISASALYYEAFIKLGASLSMLILISTGDESRDDSRRICEDLQSFVSKTTHLAFTSHCLISIGRFNPEAFFGLVVRVFTEGNVKSQIEMCKTLEMQSRMAAALAIEFREATPENVAREDHTCPICYHEMESAAVTVCSHTFHLDCLRGWIQLHMSCPMCRMPFDKKRQPE